MRYRQCIVVLAAVAAVAFGTSANAALKDAPVVFKSGNWTVLRDRDAMTDKIDCTGIYKGNFEIQLTPYELFLKTRGGVQSVTLRINDEPAQAVRLASPSEKGIGAVTIDGVDFSQVIRAERLRAQVYTVLRTVVVHDLDLTGIGPAIENIRAGCPSGQSASDTAAKPAAQVAAPSQDGPCSALMISRLMESGIEKDRRDVICRK